MEYQVHSSNTEITIFDQKNRESRKVFSPYSKKINIIYGDITDREVLEEACLNQEVVIHLAAIIPPLADEQPALAHRVNVQGTENLLRSLEKHAPKAFFLYASSVSVYGDRLEQPWIKVGDPLQASFGDEYAQTKIEAEQLIQASNLEWSIFRLTAIMGQGNHKVSGLMFHMPLDTAMEISSPEDTARAFVEASKVVSKSSKPDQVEKRTKVSRSIFNLRGGEQNRISYQEFLSRSFDVLGDFLAYN